jgi:hypothetical protein
MAVHGKSLKSGTTEETVYSNDKIMTMEDDK